jgi:hypothetical protein
MLPKNDLFLSHTSIKVTKSFGSPIILSLCEKLILTISKAKLRSRLTTITYSSSSRALIIFDWRSRERVPVLFF